MTRDERWRRIYEAVRTFRTPAVASAIMMKLNEDPDWPDRFARTYADLDAMASAGWLVEHEIVDGQGRQRRGFTARVGGPPERTPRASLLGGILRPAFA